MPGQVLSAHDREETRAGIGRDESFAEISRVLGRPTSTIAREVRAQRWPGPVPSDGGREPGFRSPQAPEAHEVPERS